MTRCLTPQCNRRRQPRYSRCEACLVALLARLFGPSDPGAAS